jgi:hypothetical protein
MAVHLHHVNILAEGSRATVAFYESIGLIKVNGLPCVQQAGVGAAA